MKKTALLNSQLSYVISCLAHGEKIVISDAGFPVPRHVRWIDLAVTSGVPSFFEVLDAVLCEMQVEKTIIADELKQDTYEQILAKLANTQAPLCHESTTHEEFKKMTKSAVCIVRTGEFTPYCNIILTAGVVF